MKNTTALFCALTFILFSIASINGCNKEKIERADSCNDGIRNHDETDIDCGGRCGACLLASFTQSGDTVIPYQLVQFNNHSQGDNCVPGVVSYLWDFGDGQTSSEHSPLRPYTSTGTFTVRLTATKAGRSLSTTSTVVVIASL